MNKEVNKEVNEEIKEFIIETNITKIKDLTGIKIDKKTIKTIENSYEFQMWKIRKKTKQLILSIAKAIGFKV